MYCQMFFLMVGFLEPEKTQRNVSKQYTDFCEYIDKSSLIQLQPCKLQYQNLPSKFIRVLFLSSKQNISGRWNLDSV